jgi:hypothetical protein
MDSQLVAFLFVLETHQKLSTHGVRVGIHALLVLHS